MTAPNDLAGLYAAFAERNGVPPFPEDAQGTGRLTFDGEVELEFQPRGDTLYVHTTLGPLPAGDEEAILLSLLAGNAPRAVADQPVLALDANLGDIVLHTAFPIAETDAERLTAGVRALLDARERCRDGLRALSGGEPGGPRGPGGLPAGPDPFLMIRG